MQNYLKKFFFIKIKTMANTKENKSLIGIPEPSLRRLPLYLSYIKSETFSERQFVSAPHIAKDLNLDPTQVTKDISYTRITGKTRIGYDVNELIKKLEDFLGYNKKNEAFLIGAGNLGSALIKYGGFEKSGLKIIAAFDNDPEKIGTEYEHIKILPAEKFKNLTERMHIEIGILCVPAEVAQEYANLMVDSGIKAIWNFAPVPVKTNKETIVENTSIYSNLAVLLKKLNA